MQVNVRSISQSIRDRGELRSCIVAQPLDTCSCSAHVDLEDMNFDRSNQTILDEIPESHRKFEQELVAGNQERIYYPYCIDDMHAQCTETS